MNQNQNRKKRSVCFVSPFVDTLRLLDCSLALAKHGRDTKTYPIPGLGLSSSSAQLPSLTIVSNHNSSMLSHFCAFVLVFVLLFVCFPHKQKHESLRTHEQTKPWRSRRRSNVCKYCAHVRLCARVHIQTCALMTSCASVFLRKIVRECAFVFRWLCRRMNVCV